MNTLLNMKSKTILFTVFLLFINLPLNQFAEEIIRSPNEKKLISFYILESERSSGHYILADPHQLPFIQYNGKSLPHDQNIINRMYTLRGTFYLDPALKDDDLAFYIGPGDYPYEVYLNGQLLLRKGSYKENYMSLIYYSSCILLPRTVLNYGENPNELAIELFPDYEVKPFSNVYLSSYSNVSKWVMIRNYFNIHLIQSSDLLAFILFLFFLMMFISTGRKNLTHLYFALQCLFFTLAYINFIFTYDSVNADLLEKISRFAFPITVVFLTLYIQESTQILNNNIIVKLIYIIPSSIASIITLFLKTKQEIDNLFDQITSSFLMFPTLLFCIILVIISLIKQKRMTDFITLLTFIGILGASFHDIVALKIGYIPYAWLVPYSYIGLVLCLFFILSYQQSHIYQSSILQSRELNNKNTSLNEIIDRIKHVTSAIIVSFTRLKEQIKQTHVILKNFEQSNITINERIITYLNSIEKVINTLKERLEKSSDRIPTAIANQTTVVEEVTATITNINQHNEKTYNSIESTDITAQNLNKIAEESRHIINESKNFIEKSHQYSGYIYSVLNTLEEVTEKTHLLSINASIESTKAGSFGKGFSVIAGEVRKLAESSQITLNTSLGKVEEMPVILSMSKALSEQVYQSLVTIIEHSKISAENISKIKEYITEQKNQSSEILKSVKSLLTDTVVIKEMSESEKIENEQIKSVLLGQKESFSSITLLLKEQTDKEETVFNALKNIETILNENLKNIETLTHYTS